MKNKIGIFLLPVSIIMFSCQYSGNKRLFLGKEYAKESLTKALKDSTDVLHYGKYLVGNEKMATDVAEALLFNIYGREKIISEKPYEIHFIESHWIIKGTLPVGADGGTFEIIIDAENASIKKLVHTR